MNEPIKRICPACGSNSVKTFGKDTLLKGKHNVCKCYDCGYKWSVLKKYDGGD